MPDQILAFPKPSQQRRVPKFLCDDGVYRFPDKREVCDDKSKKGRDEYQRRKLEMWERQGKRCALQITDICKQKQGRWPKDEIQFDHQDGRGSGGSKRDDRVWIDGKPVSAAVCPWCNCAKGSRKVPYTILVDAP